MQQLLMARKVVAVSVHHNSVPRNIWTVFTLGWALEALSPGLPNMLNHSATPSLREDSLQRAAVVDQPTCVNVEEKHARWATRHFMQFSDRHNCLKLLLRRTSVSPVV